MLGEIHMNLMSQWYGQKPWQLRYTLAVVTVGLSLLLTLLLRQILHTTPSLLFFAAVMFSSWYGGIGPGLLATVLSIFSISYFLLSPVFALSYALTDILLLGVFTLVALLTSWLNTARMQVEEKLRQSEQQFRATFNQAAVGIAHVAKNGQWLRVNQKLCDIIGYTSEELLERSFQDITHPEDLDADIGYVRQVLASEIQTYSMEKRYIHKNGSLVWINLTVSLVRKEDGEPDYFISVIEDIRERKQAEAEIRQLTENLERRVSDRTTELSIANEQLRSEIRERQQAQEAMRESEERYRQVVECCPEPIFIHTDGEIVLVNSAAVKLYGATSPEKLIGRRVIDLAHPECREIIKEQMRQLTEEGKQTELSEQKFLRFDGTVIDVEVAAIPFTYQQRLAALVVARDISDRQLVMSELRKTLEKERELSEFQSRIITTLSHEYRTPLTTIQSSAELLENYSYKWTEEKKLTHLHRIQTSTKHMTNLVSDALLIGKAEANKLEFNPVPLDVEQFCRELVEEMDPDGMSQTSITFSSQGDSNDAYLDEKLLRQILTNLLSNAIKYSPQGGIVQFDLECRDGVVRFSIQDEGIGIPAADQKRLFESFHRASNVGTLPGTGLGLSIVKKCVDLHGGQIAVESAVDVGTTFTVTLPSAFM
ncbi:MAG TPA: PAS domain S-box protein [Coleofasciculaceae cyanobacterium]